MKWFYLAWKRLSRSFVFLLSLLFLFAAICGGSLCDEAYEGLRAGYFFSGEGDNAAQVMAELEPYGFLRFETEEALDEAVRMGAVDCGILFAQDLEVRLTKAALSESFTVLVSPLSVAPTLFEEEVCTELLAVAAPYLGIPILDRLVQGESTKDAVLEVYQELWQQEGGFSVRMETVTGEVIKPVSFALSFVTLLISLFLFMIPLMQGCRRFQKNYKSIELRIGKRAARATVFFPEMMVTLSAEILVLLISLPLAVVLSGNPAFFSLMLPACACAVLLCLLDTALIFLCQNADSIQIAMIPVLLLTLAFCPLFFDFASIFPLLDGLRPLLPTYWLTGLLSHPTLCAVLLALGMIAWGVLLLCCRHRPVQCFGKRGNKDVL